MWRALRRSPRPSMCRSSSCEPPFDTAPFCESHPASAPERQFAFARGRLPHQQYYARTRDRVSDERCSQRVASARPISWTPLPLHGPQFVADANLPVLEHVCAQPAAVRERVEQRFGDDAFEIPAWLAQALPLAEDAADAEATSDQRVQRDAAGGDIAAGLARPQRDSQALAHGFEHLGFDESESAASAWHAGEVTPPRRIPVAFQANSCKHPDSSRRPHRLPFADRDVDVLDAARLCVVRHAPSYQLARKVGPRLLQLAPFIGAPTS